MKERICFMDVFLKSLISRKWAVCALFALGIVLPIFLQLGGRGLNEPDEGRYAEMGREMAVTGDWVVPRLNGVPHYAKPPWIYWCIAASLKLFGVHEWSARLPSALAAILAALAIWDLGRKMAGALAGGIAALVFVSSLLVFTAARLITPDMMLTAWITVALWCFWRWWSEEPRSTRWLLGFYLALGIAFLDKGPVGMAVAALTIAGFLGLQGRLREFTKLHWGAGLLLVALIALPWFLFMCHLNPDLYDFYLRGEIKDRVVSGRGRVKVWYYFFLVLPIACWPWTALAASGLCHHIRLWWKGREQASVSAFLISWIAFPFFLFTVSGSKLPTYILPLLPPISLLLGTWLAPKIRVGDDSLPIRSRGMTWAFLPLIGIALKFATYRTLGGVHLIWIGFGLAGLAFALLGWLMTRSLPRGRILPGQLAVWWVSTMVLLQAVLFWMPSLETELRHNSSWRKLMEPLQGKELAGIPIARDLHSSSQKPEFARAGPKVAMYEYYFRSSSFYLLKAKDEVVPLYGGSSLWEISRDIDAEAKLMRDDLVKLLQGEEQVYVFTRAENLRELRELTGMELPVINNAATGKYEVVLISNRPNRD